MSNSFAGRIQQMLPNGDLKLLAYVYLEGKVVDDGPDGRIVIKAWDEDGLPIPVPEYDTEFGWQDSELKIGRLRFHSFLFRSGKIKIRVDLEDKKLGGWYGNQNRSGYHTFFQPVPKDWQPVTELSGRLHQLTLEVDGKMISLPFRHPELVWNLTDSIASAQLVGVVDFEGGYWPIQTIGGWGDDPTSSSFKSKMNKRGGRIDINYDNMDIRWDGDFAGCKFIVNVRMHNRNKQ